jgi:hypothetical protein
MHTVNLKNVQAGDSVCVVRQKSRYSPLERTSIETVTKVGRKYGYIKSGTFSLETGQSVHNESYVRTNGMGFDVFLTQEDYE